MSDVLLPAAVAAQIDYHVEVAADLLAGGDARACAAELALVRTLLRMHGTTQSDLVEGLPRLSATPTNSDGLRRTAKALARELQAHFVSVGQKELAALYETAAAQLGSSATL